jgi:hypothetical protein
MNLPRNEIVRLYVDGDFDSRALDFWMEMCHARPDLKVYGYSKSWEFFVQRHEERPNDWPENYVLNISNSSRFWDNRELSQQAHRNSRCARSFCFHQNQF